ncbi:MAG: hypothetical protein M0Z68_05475 [Gammaproteobacteria bacterium]|nr:hypothetical protein [Gammaproteobacteria bacterium]
MTDFETVEKPRRATHGRFAKGTAPGPGRPRGSRNKTGTEARQAILSAFEQVGGITWLVQIARDEPALFVRLLAACLPRETETAGQVVVIGAQAEPRWEDGPTIKG